MLFRSGPTLQLPIIAFPDDDWIPWDWSVASRRDSSDGRCSAELLSDLIQQLRVLGNERQDDLGAIGIGYGSQRIVGIAAMLDVGELRMHIIGGIPRTETSWLFSSSAST